MAVEYYYKLQRTRLPEPKSGAFLTAALITCGLCGVCIDGMGGPGDGAVCLDCGDAIRSGQARRTIAAKGQP